MKNFVRNLKVSLTLWILWFIFLNGFANAESLIQNQEADNFRKVMPSVIKDITTIHLFSTCPMGEDIKKCAVDSYGRLHHHKNIYLCDASVLPSSPCVNPQFLIMEIASRNSLRFLENTSFSSNL